MHQLPRPFVTMFLSNLYCCTVTEWHSNSVPLANFEFSTGDSPLASFVSFTNLPFYIFRHRHSAMPRRCTTTTAVASASTFRCSSSKMARCYGKRFDFISIHYLVVVVYNLRIVFIVRRTQCWAKKSPNVNGYDWYRKLLSTCAFSFVKQGASAKVPAREESHRVSGGQRAQLSRLLLSPSRR